MSIMSRRRASDYVVTILSVILTIIVLAVLAIQPYYEAKTFNKYRKQGEPEATYWDAMFSNLRVNAK